MKYLLLICPFLCCTLACQKEPSEKKSFLYGRLIDNCNGNPVADQTVQFYQNFKKGATIFQLDTQTKLLEEVTTDADGYFYFTGGDYTNNSTVSIGNSSIRLQKNTYLASGILGKGKDAKEGDGIFLHSVGDVLLDGMLINANLKIASGTYDSVRIFSSFYNINMTLSTVQDGYFTGNIPSQKLSVKNFWGDENDTKYNLYLKFEFYSSGQISEPEYQDYFFDQCAASADIVFEH